MIERHQALVLLPTATELRSFSGSLRCRKVCPHLRMQLNPNFLPASKQLDRPREGHTDVLRAPASSSTLYGSDETRLISLIIALRNAVLLQTHPSQPPSIRLFPTSSRIMKVPAVNVPDVDTFGSNKHRRIRVWRTPKFHACCDVMARIDLPTDATWKLLTHEDNHKIFGALKV